MQESVKSTLSVVDDEEVSARQAGKSRSLLTLGGCNLEHLGGLLSRKVKHKHIWRVTIPSLVSPPINLRRKHLSSVEASDFLVRETEKKLLPMVLASDADVLVFEAAGDFHTRHLRVGDSVVVDLRTDLFGPGWAQADFSSIPELTAATVLNADDDAYWQQWLTYFEIFYDVVVRPWSSRGKSVAILARYFCDVHLVGADFRAFEHIGLIKERNRKLKRLYAELRRFKKMHFIDLDEMLYFTSPQSPHGQGDTHPDDAAYVMWQSALEQLLYEEGADASVPEGLVRLSQARSASQTKLAQVEGELAHVGAERDALEEGQRTIAAEREETRAELDAAHARSQELDTEIARIGSLLTQLSADHSTLTEQHHAATAERDELQRQLEAAHDKSGEYALEIERIIPLLHQASTEKDMITQQHGEALAEIEKLHVQARELADNDAQLHVQLAEAMQLRVSVECEKTALAANFRSQLAGEFAERSKVAEDLRLALGERDTAIEQRVALASEMEYLQQRLAHFENNPAAADTLFVGQMGGRLSAYGFHVDPSQAVEEDAGVVLHPAEVDRSGAAVHGPYKRLAPGSYILTGLLLRLPRRWVRPQGEITFDVHAPAHDAVLCSASFAPREGLVSVQLRFEWAKERMEELVEIRCHQRSNVPVRLLSLSLAHS